MSTLANEAQRRRQARFRAAHAVRLRELCRDRMQKRRRERPGAAYLTDLRAYRRRMGQPVTESSGGSVPQTKETE